MGPIILDSEQYGTGAQDAVWQVQQCLAPSKEVLQLLEYSKKRFKQRYRTLQDLLDEPEEQRRERNASYFGNSASSPLGAATWWSYPAPGLNSKTIVCDRYIVFVRKTLNQAGTIKCRSCCHRFRCLLEPSTPLIDQNIKCVV